MLATRASLHPVILAALLLLSLALLAWPARAQATPVTVRIQVIEARKKGAFDPKITSLKSAMPGYEGAKLVDELETKVEPGGSVSLEILDKKRVLKVTVVDVAADGVVKLKLDIDAFKMSTTTKHVRDNATVVVAKPLDADKALFLAVTTRKE